MLVNEVAKTSLIIGFHVLFISLYQRGVCQYFLRVYSLSFHRFLDSIFLKAEALYFLTEVLLAHTVTLVSGVQHSDSMSVYILLCSPQVRLPSVTAQHYYSLID